MPREYKRPRPGSESLQLRIKSDRSDSLAVAREERKIGRGSSSSFRRCFCNDASDIVSINGRRLDSIISSSTTKNENPREDVATHGL